MPLVAAYFRPGSLGEALRLLRLPQRVALAGGTTLNAGREPSDMEAVDLQALDLADISATDSGRVNVGATATLDEMRRCPLLPSKLRELARREQPSTLRTLATVGGIVAKAGPESLLLSALLAHSAVVEIAGPAAAAAHDGGADPAVELRHRALADVLDSGVPAGALITRLDIDPGGVVAFSATGRTPADVPIVAAYARLVGTSIMLALSGVAPHPVLADPQDPTAGLDPAGDFRGSGAYRLDLAETLARRVISELSR